MKNDNPEYLEKKFAIGYTMITMCNLINEHKVGRSAD